VKQLDSVALSNLDCDILAILSTFCDWLWAQTFACVCSNILTALILMYKELTKLTSKLEKLRLLQTKEIEELQSIEIEHQAVDKLIRKSQGLTGTDSRGNNARTGNKVTTLNCGKYYERITKITFVKADNHIKIQYLISKINTWRKGHNLLKLQK